MPLTVTAAPSTDGMHVELTATGGVPPYTWTADPDGAPTYTVPPLATDTSGATAWDGFAAFGVATTYLCRDSTGASATTLSVALPVPATPILSDAQDPTRWLAVTVVAQPPNTWEARSVWFDVMDRRDPFVAVAPMRLRSGDLLLRTGTPGDRAALVELAAPGSPLLLRSTCPDAVDDVVMLPLSVRDELVLDDAPTGARLFTITYQAVTRELGPYLPDPTWTWDTMLTDPRTPTWAAVLASFATWDDTVSNVRSP